MSLATLALIRQSFIRETAFIAAELQVAETVQRSMLPDDARTPARAIVAYHYEPVLRVGGDWFSVIESRNKQDIYVILGDVTGHGLAQGLVTTAVAGALQVLESLIHDFGSTAVVTPSQIVTQLNNVITRIAGKSNLRMTCVAAKLELESRRLLVCNAGHTFPLMIRKQAETVKVETLTRKQQFMLGEETARENGFSYSDAEYALGDEDVLLLYTDGLTDAVDKEGKSFSRKFYRFFSRIGEQTAPHQVKDDLIKLLRAHTQDVPVKDDICVLVITRKPEREVGVA
jgi:sigma-B regulation protein RsbU (phosphoserine phosphatase)